MRLSGQFKARLFFLRKDFEPTKAKINQNQPTKTKISVQKTTKKTVFCVHENFLEGENCWCFLNTQNFFVKKMALNCPDSLILLYYWRAPLSTRLSRIYLYTLIFTCVDLWESLLFIRIFLSPSYLLSSVRIVWITDYVEFFSFCVWLIFCWTKCLSIH